MIDQASVFAERFKGNPQVLQATVLGQGNIPGLDPYTALNALRLIKESNAMQTAAQAQQPTSSPSIVAENMAPPPMQQGLGAMVPNTMGQAPQGQAPQGQAPQGQAPQAPQAPVMQASGGLAGMPVPEEDYAAGGIVAFNGEEDSFVRDPNSASDMLILGSEANNNLDRASQSIQDRATTAQEEYSNFEPAEMTAAQEEAIAARYDRRMQRAAGPDIYAPAKEQLLTREKARAGDKKYGQGLALLAAAGKVLKGHTLAMGASEALPAFATEMAKVQQADQQEQRSIEQMNFALADAQRKERMGDARGQQAAIESARKSMNDANRAKGEKLRYSADIATRNVQYSRPSAKSAGAQPSAFNVLFNAQEALADDPTNLRLQARVKNALSATAATKTTVSTSVTDNPEGGPRARKLEAEVDTGKAKAIADINRKVMEEMRIWDGGIDARRARGAGPATFARAKETAEKEFRRQATQGMSNSGGATTPPLNSGLVLNYDANGKRIK